MGLFSGMFKQNKPGRWDTGVYTTPGIGDGLDQGAVAEEDNSFFTTGKPRGSDWIGLALGAVGDAFARTNGGEAFVTPLAMRSILGAKEARQAAESKKSTVAALVARGIPESEAVILAGDRQQTSEILGNKYKPQVNDTERDFNWYNNLSPADKQLYDQFNPVVVQTQNGPVAVPRTGLGGDAQAGRTVSFDPRTSANQNIPSGNPLAPPPMPGDPIERYIQFYGDAVGRNVFANSQGVR